MQPAGALVAAKTKKMSRIKSRGRRRCAAAAACWVAAWRKERLESGLVDFFSTTSGRRVQPPAAVFNLQRSKPPDATPQPQARGCGRKSASRNWTALFGASDWGRAMSSPVRWGRFITTLSVQRRVPLSQALGPGPLPMVVVPSPTAFFLVSSSSLPGIVGIQLFSHSFALSSCTLLLSCSPETTGAWYRLHSFSRSCPIFLQSDAVQSFR